jgi:EAL domain-containing protein (putative c-di-GMP-specific phosphodiesterase class I)
MNDIGIRLSIDDFGTGYSSLSYLRNFPFEILKIDRAFIRDGTQSDEGLSLLRAIIAMARSLNLDIIAEGVELPAQYELLCELSCGFAQGMFFAEPLPAEAVQLMGDLPGDSGVG